MSPSSDFKTRLRSDRLDFHLHNFRRLCWVDEQAQALWEPRLVAVREWIVHREVYEPYQPIEVPPCCAAAHEQNYPYEEPILQILANSSFEETDTNLAEMAIQPALNIILRPLSLYLYRYHPCSFQCVATASTYTPLVREYTENPPCEEAKWLAEILQWPIQWSALHGIAEILSPVFKLVLPTRATAYKYSLRFMEGDNPEKAARGIQFPYRLPNKKRLTASQGFQNGLHAIEKLPNHQTSNSELLTLKP